METANAGEFRRRRFTIASSDASDACGNDGGRQMKG
jgi:hypothetical protein